MFIVHFHNFITTLDYTNRVDGSISLPHLAFLKI